MAFDAIKNLVLCWRKEVDEELWSAHPIPAGMFKGMWCRKQESPSVKTNGPVKMDTPSTKEILHDRIWTRKGTWWRRIASNTRSHHKTENTHNQTYLASNRWV